MIRAMALLFVTACGTAPEYHPRAVDPIYADTFYVLASDVNDALGYGCLARDPDRGTGEIVADNRRVAEAGELLGAAIAGFADVTTKTVVMREADPRVFPSAAMLMTHEVGHMLGLDHADTGLMSPHGDATCIGREAACLVLALQEDRE